MATGTLTPSPYQTVLDSNGNPVSGAKIYTYLAGTTTAASTYTDSALSVANANPIIADSAGRFVAYLTPGAAYKFVYQTSAGAAILTQDNIGAVPPTTINNDVTGTAGETLTAGQLVYLSDGSGSKTAGQWYKADLGQAYSSLVPMLGMAVADIATGATGTVRLAGQITGLSGLVVGSAYGVGSAGAIVVGGGAESYGSYRVIGVADTTTTLVFAPDPPLIPPTDAGLCEGRLTLTSGTAVTTSDVTAATTLYFTPYKGNRITLYDGTRWYVREFGEASVAVPATTSTVYDVFAADSGTAVTLSLVAWTNDTTRATELATRSGVYVDTLSSNKKYLGTFRTTGVSGQTEDSAAKRYVWNYYHRLPRRLSVVESTDSWTYTTATWRQARATATNQVDVVVGVAEAPITLTLQASATNSSAGVGVASGIGEDSTTAPLAGSLYTYQTTGAANAFLVNVARVQTYPVAGRHYYAWLEYSVATGTTTWNGDAGGTLVQSGLVGSIDG